MFNRAKIMLVLLLPVTVSCTNTLPKQEYVQWVTSYDNGCHVKAEVTDFVFDLQYQPAEYVVLQRGISDRSAFADELKSVGGMQYYTLEVSIRDNSDLIEYGVSSVAEREQKQYYLSYRFQNDIVLEEGGRHHPCVLYHFEKALNTNGGRRMMLGFESMQPTSKEATLVIQSGVFSTLPIKIKIRKSNIPQVEI